MTSDGDARQPAFDVIDFGLPIQTSDPTSELELVDNNILSSQAGANCASELDPSWFAVAKSGVGCVLCTVRGFQLRCGRSVIGMAAKESEGKDIQCVDGTAACEQCGLQHNWHTPNMRVCGRADDRLRDDELVCVARVVALWEQMKSASASLGKIDTKQMAAACIWLETGSQGR